jgi:hypothetical protein
MLWAGAGQTVSAMVGPLIENHMLFAKGWFSTSASHLSVLARIDHLASTAQ